MSRIAIQAVLLIWFGGLLSAQQLPPSFARWHPGALVAGESTLDSAQQAGAGRLHQDDYRYEGLIFGGVALGTLGAWAGSQISGGCPLTSGNDCGTDRVGQAIALGLAGAAIGGGLGYLVGRASPKRPPPVIIPQELFAASVEIPDSVRLRVGHQHWRGAAIGTAIGAVLGGIVAIGAGAGCSDCATTTEDRVKAALVVTGGAGVVGFLAGLATPRYEWVHRGDAGEFGSDSNRE
jgi:hypothetical protein